MSDIEKVVTVNRKAWHDYEIIEKFEAGISLLGSEVKALRDGRANLKDSYAAIEGNRVVLRKCHISPYAPAGPHFQHEPERPRPLLLHKRQIERLTHAIQAEGMTLVPMKLYFNDRGMAKLELALAKGKRMHDKRETEKRRDWQRDKARLLRERG